ncbi:MAG: YceI family protein [Planctomycetes bacterium]|nr:YceI family protein [Planctomycetota bacterium]
MTQKLLQWMGVAFVLLLVGGAAFALTVVKDRVRVVVAADAAEAGPDPVALVRDDVGVLARDVAELRTALGTNFERLGAALEERAEARHADVQALARELAAARQQLAAQAAAAQRSEQQLAQLGARLAAAESAAVQSVAVPAESVPAESVPAASAPVVPAPIEPAPAEPVAVAPPPAKAKGFLSFSLPQGGFAFDREQSWQIVPELSRVGFDAKSTLHDFSGVTSKVSGRFTADFDDPAGGWRGEVACEAATLATGVDGRDTNLREHLDTTNHPQIRFTIARFVPAADGIDRDEQTVAGEVQGTMTIRGKSRELRLPVRIEIDPSRRAVVTGQVRLKLSDYEVPVPSQLGVINMQDEVVVWVALRARLVAGDGK